MYLGLKNGFQYKLFLPMSSTYTTPCSQHHLCASLMPIEEIPPFVSECYHAFYPLTGWAWTVLVLHPGFGPGPKHSYPEIVPKGALANFLEWS